MEHDVVRMTPELARVCLQFLHRTTLQGSEVPAFIEVVRAVETLANALVKPLRSVEPSSDAAE